MAMTIAGLGTALHSAQSGLAAAQRALDVVANNVANANTPGYSRKEAHFDHRLLGGLGVGVGIERIGRVVDAALLTTLRGEKGALAAAAVTSSFEARLQDLFGTPESDTSLAHTLAGLQAAVEALAASPGGAVEAREVVRRGAEAADALNRLGATVQQLRADADRRIAEDVREADGLLQRIADLNGRVVRERYAGRDATGLEDERDRAVDRLSELLDVKVMARAKGDVVILTAGGRTLVDSAAVRLSHQPASALGALATYATGDIGGIHAGEVAPENDLTRALAEGDGEIGALIRLRDTTLPDVQSSLDQLAATLKETVNAVHNAGTAFPGLARMTGSRVFADPGTETIRLAGGDTALVLFGRDGRQHASIALSTLMGGGTGPWAIADVASGLDAWLKANADPLARAEITDGRLVIDLAGGAYGLAMRDQETSLAESEARPATIGYSADGGAGADETVEGFSRFFGLNDFFTDATSPAIRQSAVLAAGWRTAAGGTLELRDGTGVIGTPVVIAPGSGLADIAARITAATGVRAEVVPDGDGVRLRLAADRARTLIVTDAAGGLVGELALKPATTGLAGGLGVRTDIAADPLRLARGSVRFDATLGAEGEYVLGEANGATATALAAALAEGQAFGRAGGFAAADETLAGYAGRIIATSAARAAEAEESKSFQGDFVATLQARSDSVRGVNIDEELSDMMLFEQAYTAAARVLGVIQKMFDALDAAL